MICCDTKMNVLGSYPTPYDSIHGRHVVVQVCSIAEPESGDPFDAQVTTDTMLLPVKTISLSIDKITLSQIFGDGIDLHRELKRPNAVDLLNFYHHVTGDSRAKPFLAAGNVTIADDIARECIVFRAQVLELTLDLYEQVFDLDSFTPF